MAFSELDCSIDYSRFYALPFGLVPKVLNSDSLKIYFLGLGAKTEFLYYDKSQNADTLIPAENDPVAPGWKDEEWIRFRTIGLSNIAVPRSSAFSPAIPISLKKDDFTSYSKHWKDPVVFLSSDTADDIARKVTGTMRWDSISQKANGLPIPMFTDENLLVLWPKTSASYPALQNPALPGFLASNGSFNIANPVEYILETSANQWTGEMTPDLIRAPAFGFLRFERYRHIFYGTKKLSLINPSAIGRLVLQIPPNQDAFPPPTRNADILEDQILIIENITHKSVVQYLTSLLIFQVINFSSTLGREEDPIKRDISKTFVVNQFSTLLRTWFAYQRVYGAVSSELAAHANELKNKKKVSFDQVQTMFADISANPTTLDSLTTFIRDTYMPIICGTMWHELNVNLPVAESQEPKKSHPDDYEELVSLSNSPDTWLTIFAGCPLGRPAPIYSTANPQSPQSTLRAGYTAFEMEALVLANEESTVFGVAGTTPADISKSIALDSFVSFNRGNLAVIRLVEKNTPEKATFKHGYGRVQAFTTRGWLLAVVKGQTKRAYMPPQFDFEPYASRPSPDQRHPLAEILDWNLFRQAKLLRNSLDLAEMGAPAAPRNELATKSLNFWKNQPNLLTGAGFPALTINGFDTREPPDPSTPYQRASSVNNFEALTKDCPIINNIPKPCNGIDYFDIEAAFMAQRAIRSGKDGITPPHIAIVLALMQREGYRVTIPFDRDLLPMISRLEPANVHASFRNNPSFLRALTRINWLMFPFGLDRWVYASPLNPILATNPNFLKATTDHFQFVFDEVTRPFKPAEPHKAILQLEYLPRQALRDYIENGLEAKWLGDTLTRRRLSRRIQWVGIALQLAKFEWMHRLLHLGVAIPHENNAILHSVDKPAFRDVKELRDPAYLPTPGTDANSRERREFIAYFTLIYLAFNTSAMTFNLWADAFTNFISGSTDTVSSAFLLFRNTNPNAKEPPGSSNRLLGQRGNALRFAAALDAFLRLDSSGGMPDFTDPGLRNTTAKNNWKLVSQ